MNEPATYEMNEESRNLLLFNYLEGDLTEERAAMLEKALSTDQELQAELDLWKESFVVQDFYATDALEQQLLQKVKKPFSFSGSAAGFLFLLMASLLSFITAGEEEHVPRFINRPLSVPPVIEAVPTGDKALGEKSREDKLAIQAITAPLQPEEQQAILLVQPIAITDRIEALPYIPVGKPESSSFSPVINLPAVFTNKGKSARQHSIRDYSRKKERQIRRMKEKALQQRKANEFIKGNRPYVVPLDTQNF